jgi:hypothetical protein
MDEIIEAIGWSLESGTTYRKYNLIVRIASKTHHMVQMKLLENTILLLEWHQKHIIWCK